MTETGMGGRSARPVPERGEVRVNGIRLVYRSWPGPTTPSYPSAVLLHGVLQSGEGLANVAAHLARAGRVVVPDLRGRGESDQPEAGYDPATMADDIAALIAALGLDRPVVVGRLHGGLVAYHLAARHPGRVRGLVLGDTSPEVDERRAARALATIRALPPRFASLAEATAFYEETLQLSAERARHDLPHDLVADEAGGYRWRHNRELVERIEAASLPRADWDVLGRVRCPTLLLRGQRGQVPPEMAERFRGVVAGCRVQTILGARHDVFLGPGAEQAFGALDLFLLRLQEAAEPAAATDDGSGQLPLPGAEPPAASRAEGQGPAAIIERVVRAINGRDDAAVAALFAPDGRIVQYRAGGKVREGGPPAARDALRDIFSELPGGTVETRDLVAADDRVACVLTIRDASGDGAASEVAILAPIFLRLRDDRIVEFTSYGLRLPADEI